MNALKKAMIAKDTIALESLRAVKSAILLAKTEAGAAAELAGEEGLKLPQKLVKQHKGSAALYARRGRNNLTEPELAQVAVMEKFLPKQLSEAEVTGTVKAIIIKVGGISAKDMGKIMGVATEQLAGKTDRKVISVTVRSLLT